MKTQCVLICASMVLCAVGPAQAEGLYFAGGYADRKVFSGLEVEFGYRKTFDKVGLNIAPVSGIWHENKDGRYREETFSNGSTVCRDTSNGQFADDENCDPDLEYAVHASADYAFTGQFRAGAGVRIAKKSSGYLSASFAVSPTINIGVRGGSQYAAVNVSFSF